MVKSGICLRDANKQNALFFQKMCPPKNAPIPPMSRTGPDGIICFTRTPSVSNIWKMWCKIPYAIFMEPSNSTWLCWLTLKIVTSKQIKKNLMIYYYLNTLIEVLIFTWNFIHIYKLETKESLLPTLSFTKIQNKLV